MADRIIPDCFSELLYLRSAVQACMTVSEEVLEVLPSAADELAAEYRGIYEGIYEGCSRILEGCSRILELIEKRLFSMAYPVYCELCLFSRRHTLVTFSRVPGVFSVCPKCRKLLADDPRR